MAYTVQYILPHPETALYDVLNVLFIWNQFFYSFIFLISYLFLYGVTFKYIYSKLFNWFHFNLFTYLYILTVGSEPPQKVYPASMKMAMRNHLRRLCLQPHCVDSLFLFLNSPARSDGSSLLWDANDNGLVGRLLLSLLPPLSSSSLLFSLPWCVCGCLARKNAWYCL